MALHWTPAVAPTRSPIRGTFVNLLPVDAEAHAADLFEAARGSDAIWDYLAYGPFPDLPAFRAWLTDRAASHDPLFFAIVDAASDRALGMASYMRMDPPNGAIEIGHIWFAPALQRTRSATEAIYLLSRHAFQDLGNRRLEWKCDSLNAKSMRAAERFGFVYEGIFRQHMVIKGRNRDTAWYSITDGEWPLRRAAFEAWLDDANFDARGVQLRSLEALRKSLEAVPS